MTDEYNCIFDSYTFSDASSIMSIYSKVSYNLYQITNNDDFDFEKYLLIRIISFIIFEKVKPSNWKIGASFTPVIITGNEEYDLYSIISDNFNHDSSGWNFMLKGLNINAQDEIQIH